jgi:hypothetical protein
MEAAKEKASKRRLLAFKMVAEWTGLEPATPGVTGRYSNQLNYHSAVVATFRLAPQVSPDLYLI